MPYHAPLLKSSIVQPIEWQTDPYFIFKISQNMTTDCLVIYLFLPEFTCCEPKTVFIYGTIFCSQHVNSGKYREIQLNMKENIDLSPIN